MKSLSNESLCFNQAIMECLKEVNALKVKKTHAVQLAKEMGLQHLHEIYLRESNLLTKVAIKLGKIENPHNPTN